MAGRVHVHAAHPKAARMAKRVAEDAERFLDALKVKNAELSVALVGDAEIRKLNRTWRGKNKPTDVLSFPAGEHPKGVPGPKALGDVVISLDTAARVAMRLRVPLRDEVTLYLAHGLLHLLGHDHEESPQAAKKMARLEAKLLGGLGLIARSEADAG